MGHLIVGVNDGIFAVFFLAVFQSFWIRVGCRKSDAPGIRRPFESIHVIFGFGQLLRFAAVGRNNVELFFAFWGVLDLSGAVGKKSDPFAVEGPFGVGARFFCGGERMGIICRGIRNPQVSFEGVIFPIGLLDFVDDALAVG